MNPEDHGVDRIERRTLLNFTTEPGMKELGWVGRTARTELPRCTHPSPEHG